MKHTAYLFKALGDSTRLEIVHMLAGKELCVCDILDAFHVSQPAISHHLRNLKQAGILLDRKEGKWVFYRLNPEGLLMISHFLQPLISKSSSLEQCPPTSPHRLK